MSKVIHKFFRRWPIPASLLTLELTSKQNMIIPLSSIEKCSKATLRLNSAHIVGANNLNSKEKHA